MSQLCAISSRTSTTRITGGANITQMTRSELFDRVFDAVYESVFKVFDKEPYGSPGYDDDDEIDWGENISDYDVRITVTIDMKPPEKRKVRVHKKRVTR